MMKTMLLAGALIAGFLMLSGCSFNPIGESTFDCNRKENPSEYCRSFKAFERSTNGPLPESRFDREFRMSDHDRATGIAPDGSKDQPAQSASTGATRLPHERVRGADDAMPGMPIRKAAVVQRALIKRFVDENDSVQENVIVYREVQAPRWAGFAAVNRGNGMPNAYPHRPKPNSPAGADSETPPPQQTDLTQPTGRPDGLVGPAMPPAGSQSGGAN
jgi:conjugal transfer pilus assembly protein TraV